MTTSPEHVDLHQMADRLDPSQVRALRAVAQQLLRLARCQAPVALSEVSKTPSPDPYRDPASGVFRNLLAITDPSELAEVEAALSASRLIDLELRRLRGTYDLDHLRAFHRYILGDVYAWAGELRAVSISKGSLFCLPEHLESYSADIFGRLAAADRLCGLAREQFIGRLAEFLADVNALHPFREGNGRAQRAFISQLAHDAGHHVDWVRMDPALTLLPAPQPTTVTLRR